VGWRARAQLAQKLCGPLGRAAVQVEDCATSLDELIARKGVAQQLAQGVR